MKRQFEVVDPFPLRDEVEDFSGRRRCFEITCHRTPVGFSLRAAEIGASDAGYEFRAYSETTPSAALGRLRNKMYRELATRHLAGSSGDYHMTHDKLRGRITWDSENGVALVVDGVALSLEEFASLLGSYEGWNFELRITDSLE
jgi:hypothetical protein